MGRMKDTDSQDFVVLRRDRSANGREVEGKIWQGTRVKEGKP